MLDPQFFVSARQSRTRAKCTARKRRLFGACLLPSFLGRRNRCTKNAGLKTVKKGDHMKYFVMRRLGAGIAGVVTLGLAMLPATATAFEPKKLEDIAHFTTAGGTDCASSALGVGKTFASRIVDRGLQNGVDRFGLNIPPGQVFIMTSIQVSVFGGTPFDSSIIRVVNSAGGGGGVEYVFTSREYDSLGRASVEVAFPVGRSDPELHAFLRRRRPRRSGRKHPGDRPRISDRRLTKWKTARRSVLRFGALTIPAKYSDRWCISGKSRSI